MWIELFGGNRMKILQINSVCGYGSTGRIATDIYKILEEQGHECLIAYGRGSIPEGIKSIKIGNIIDNYIHVAKTRLLDKHGFSSTNATREFIEKIKIFNPDIIHLHNIHGYYVNIEMLFNYLKEARKPIIWTLHDCWAFTGHCAYFDYVGCDKWKNGCYNCPQKNSYPQSLIKDNSKYNYKKKRELFNGINNMTIITPSNWLAELVKDSFLNPYDIKVINNGIDLNVFKPKDKSIFRKKYGLEDKFIILGVASVWDQRKGLDYFIKLSELIDSGSKIVLVGLNDKQVTKLPANIIVIKRTNNLTELSEIYSAADVFLNPTLEDNFPTTNLEAMACGTPVIVFNTGGSAESLDDNCGYVVAKGNIDALVDAIEQYKENNVNITQTHNCIKRAKKYDKKSKFDEYITIYHEVLGE